MGGVAANLRAVARRIEEACGRGGRPASDVRLIAVSKTFPAAAVREALDAGQVLFGESRQQEAEPKIAALPREIRWHFIGRVQRNKVRKLLPLFEVIHGIDSLRLAVYTGNVALELGLRAKVFLQVNSAGEASKAGFPPEALAAELPEILALPGLEVLGLMTIPPLEADAEAARPWFRALRKLRDRLEETHRCRLPELSMGMSGDFETAIEEGATFVRVGSAIFGDRSYGMDDAAG